MHTTYFETYNLLTCPTTVSHVGNRFGRVVTLGVGAGVSLLSVFKKTEGLELGAVDKLLVGIFAGRDEGGKDFPNSPCPPLLFSLCYPITKIKQQNPRKASPLRKEMRMTPIIINVNVK
jgi:hypothetical protein